MSDSLKEQLEEVQEKIASICDRIEDQAEDFAEDAQELWGKSRQELNKLSQRLADAAHQVQASSEEARLQGHLAAMDAGDHWQEMKHSVSSFLAHAAHKARPPLEHAALQAHLAKMEARDFMADAGKDLAEEFKGMVEQAEQRSKQAALDIKESCDGLIAGLPK